MFLNLRSLARGIGQANTKRLGQVFLLSFVTICLTTSYVGLAEEEPSETVIVYPPSKDALESETTTVYIFPDEFAERWPIFDLMPSVPSFPNFPAPTDPSPDPEEPDPDDCIELLEDVVVLLEGEARLWEMFGEILSIFDGNSKKKVDDIRFLNTEIDRVQGLIDENREMQKDECGEDHTPL